MSGEIKNGCKLYKDCFTCPYDDCKKPQIQAQYSKEYYQRNRDRIREYQRQYRKDHPKMQIEANQRWAEKNRDRKNELQRAYYQRRKERLNNDGM